MSSELIVTVSIACSSPTEAEALARLLVDRRLAACVQMHPMQSVFRWDGEIVSADEVMLTAKTLHDRLAAIEAVVTEHHVYQVPEILATAVDWASSAYANWLHEALNG